MTTMQFEIRKSVPIPPAALRRRASVHPFPWDKMESGDSFVVPVSYWTEERGLSKESSTPERNRGRILGSFKTWRSASKRNDVRLLSRTQDTGDVEVWMVSTAGPSATSEEINEAAEEETQEPKAAKAKGGKKK